MPKRPPVIPDNTPEQEAATRRAITEDPDTWEIAEDSVPIRVGRPPGRTKEQVTVRLDKDLISELKKPDPKGWQTRLNAAARAGLKM
ncbi:BrnA antitoxin family protein [Minwuia sp.]|uniref:BrnA antitoxin family protein n=1 Tax=Minwuia sp. TaxID=2493630 RepID=UPI003A8CF2D6